MPLEWFIKSRWSCGKLASSDLDSCSPHVCWTGSLCVPLFSFFPVCSSQHGIDFYRLFSVHARTHGLAQSIFVGSSKQLIKGVEKGTENNYTHHCSTLYTSKIICICTVRVPKWECVCFASKGSWGHAAESLRLCVCVCVHKQAKWCCMQSLKQISLH